MTEYINKTELLNNMSDTDMLDKEEVAEIPAEDVAPIKHGKWLEDGEDDMIGENSATCSECKDVYCCGDVDFKTFAKFYKYCPNCGAKMDGE